MMRDPAKMMGLVSSVGEKLDKKLKNGDIKESEMLEEAADMLKKLQDMPGMGGFKEMFKKFAGGGKMDMSGMQAKVSQNLKRAKTKERLQKKLQERQPMEKAVFSTGETVEKSTAAQKKKRKKNKKPKSIDAPILDA
jgi:myosin heavy subunit